MKRYLTIIVGVIALAAAIYGTRKLTRANRALVEGPLVPGKTTYIPVEKP